MLARFPQPILEDPALVPGLLNATVAALAPACTDMFGCPLPQYYWLLVGSQGPGGKNTANSFRVPGATGCTSLAPDWEVAGIFFFFAGDSYVNKGILPALPVPSTFGGDLTVA